jgi:RNA polymerase sigma factor (sigma-70 family)
MGMTATQTDAEVIVASLSDPEVFATLFRRHHAAIFRYLARRLDGPIADDLAAETFVLAFRGRGAYVPLTRDARPWLFGIAANLLRRHHRAEARGLRARERSESLEVSAGAHEGVPERLDAAFQARRAVRALRAMPRGEREALLLFAWADLSYAEIAVALGIPDGTVRSRISRARRRLRDELASCDETAVAAMVKGDVHA